MDKDEPRIIRQGRFVAPFPERQPPATVEATPLAALLPTALHSAQARQSDDALTNAKAALLMAGAYIAAAGLITTGLLLLAWLFRALGDAFATYAYVGLLVWGLAVLAALWANRRQSLHHSATGIAHHELASRERLARYAIDKHVELLMCCWKLDRYIVD